MLREETAEEEMLVEDTEKVNILIIISGLPFEKVTILISIPILSLLSILMTFFYNDLNPSIVADTFIVAIQGICCHRRGLPRREHQRHRTFGKR